MLQGTEALPDFIISPEQVIDQGRSGHNTPYTPFIGSSVSFFYIFYP
jgi:hypothetical protein